AIQTAELTASDGAYDDDLGFSVAVSGDGSTLVAGAYRHEVRGNTQPGAAYVFVKPNTGWVDGTQTAELTASDGAAYDWLGQSVAVSADGSFVVAGAIYHKVGSNWSQGSAYLFVRPAGGWVDETESAELTSADGAEGDHFGASVAVNSDGATVVGGAPSRSVGTNGHQGTAYVFEATWLQVTPRQLTSRLYPTQDEDQTLRLTNDSDLTANYQMFAVPVATTWAHLSPVIQGNAPNLSASVGRAPAGLPKAPTKVGSLPDLTGAPAFGIDLTASTLVYWPDITAPAGWSTVAPEPGTNYWGGTFYLGDFSKLFVVDAATDSLATLDTTTGAATVIGTATPNPGDTWIGLTATNTGVMYGAATVCNGTTSNLYTIDPTTGAATLVGAITNAPCLINLAADAAGGLYGVDIWNNNLVKVNPATGAGTVVGPTGIVANYVQGLSFDMGSGTLYWAAYNQTSAQGELRVIDTTTGASTLIGAFPNGDEVGAFAIESFAGPTLPWLTLTPSSGSVGPGGGVPIDAHFIADGADHFGLLRATIKTTTDTPYPVNDVSVCFTKAFLDVPAGYWADAFVHGIAGARITTGCGSGSFCPDQPMTRGTMARWLLLARYGNLYAPPPCQGIFADVPCETTPNADYIEDLYNKGITAGCGTNPLRYCPNDPVLREQMAVFIDVAAGFAPPPSCTDQRFDDVPCSSPYAPFINDIANRGITAGCSTNPPLFCPSEPTTRAQEAVFVLVAWQIPLCY
ncbi:MAG: S-layer homology domain-containing protein, partial [Betaproteobacteria bacterium]